MFCNKHRRWLDDGQNKGKDDCYLMGSNKVGVCLFLYSLLITFLFLIPVLML